MRRLVASVLLAVVLILVVPGAASADKDPFKPVTGPGTSTGSVPSSGTTFTQPSIGGPTPASTGPALPRTGIDADVLLGIALIFLIAGTALLSAERYFRTY